MGLTGFVMSFLSGDLDVAETVDDQVGVPAAVALGVGADDDVGHARLGLGGREDVAVAEQAGLVQEHLVRGLGNRALERGLGLVVANRLAGLGVSADLLGHRAGVDERHDDSSRGWWGRRPRPAPRWSH